ncbi:hypothetical protein KQX54_012492 [Cotesia glomerata]|uniref:Uncharacterized protein n=1 Tax=Cotesia glomerata TaxID=32391 RepID=A0AAV7I291_COTGL|nr:hypothetical protein KQX54_012492 [Cotesia glomerata]
MRISSSFELFNFAVDALVKDKSSSKKNQQIFTLILKEYHKNARVTSHLLILLHRFEVYMELTQTKNKLSTDSCLIRYNDLQTIDAVN